jgi:hypothetical protein
MAGVFISYRRADSGGRTGRLYEHLSTRFPRTPIFLDFEDIPPGANFPDVIRDAIRTSDVVLVIIGPLWLKGADGRRRLDDPQDQLRLEIVEAGQSKRTIIPVLVGDAHMPSAADLPEPLQFLAYRNAFELSDSRWQYDVERLASRLRNLLGASTDRAPAANRLQALLRRPLLRVGRMTLSVRSVLLLVLAIAVVALTVVWIRESGWPPFPPPGPVPVPSSAPTPIYEAGLITYLTTEQDQNTLSVLHKDGTSTVLARGADVRVLAVSPDQRYLVVATSPEPLSCDSSKGAISV